MRKRFNLTLAGWDPLLVEQLEEIRLGSGDVARLLTGHPDLRPFMIVEQVDGTILTSGEAEIELEEVPDERESASGTE